MYLQKSQALLYTTFFAFFLDNDVFAKIRTLMTSALWIRAMLRTRLMFQSSFAII